MNALHVIPGVAPRYGGPSLAIVGMCRALCERGIATTIASTNADGDGRLNVPTGVETAYEGIPAIFFPRTGEGFKYSPELARWLRRSVARFDVVHIHAVFSHSSVSAARACRRAGVPYIVRPLGSLDPWSLRQKAFQKRLLFWTAVRAMLAGAAAVHYTTEDERAAAETTIGSLPSIVVPLGVDASLASRPVPGMIGRSHHVVALTRLHPKKRLELLVAAFLDPRFAAATRDWRLVIAGAGDAAYERQLRDLAERLGGGDRVVFSGWVDGSAKATLLATASVFAMPSHTENFGLGLLEALASGTPAVMTRSVNLSGIVDAAGAGWVTGEDAGAFAEALHAAMCDLGEREKRGRAARQLASRYTWEATAESLEAAYRSIARPRAGQREPEPASVRGRG